MLESTLRGLELLGYAVVGAKTGAEAIDVSQSGQSIALVFSVDVPGGMTGYALADGVFNRGVDLNVVPASGYASVTTVPQTPLVDFSRALPKARRARRLPSEFLFVSRFSPGVDPALQRGGANERPRHVRRSGRSTPRWLVSILPLHVNNNAPYRSHLGRPIGPQKGGASL